MTAEQCNILITGITGYLGRNLTKYLLDNKIECTIIGTAHSETKIAHFKKSFPDIKIYVIELSSNDLEIDIDSIILNHHINYIIHTAAMKHVDICQEHLITALKINVIAVDILVKMSKKYQIKNFIFLSTDKTNNPCNIYGMTKYIAQKNVIDNGFTVFQGVNFFWSDGSVLDIWFNQYIRNKPLTIRNPEHVRYFTTIEYVSKIIYENLNGQNKFILPDNILSIKTGDLLHAFMKYFNYNNYLNTDQYDFEKITEEINDDIKNIIEPTEADLIGLIDRYYKNML